MFRSLMLLPVAAALGLSGCAASEESSTNTSDDAVVTAKKFVTVANHFACKINAANAPALEILTQTGPGFEAIFGPNNWTGTVSNSVASIDHSPYTVELDDAVLAGKRGTATLVTRDIHEHSGFYREAADCTPVAPVVTSFECDVDDFSIDITADANVVAHLAGNATATAPLKGGTATLGHVTDADYLLHLSPTLLDGQVGKATLLEQANGDVNTLIYTCKPKLAP